MLAYKMSSVKMEYNKKYDFVDYEWKNKYKKEWNWQKIIRLLGEDWRETDKLYWLFAVE